MDTVGGDPSKGFVLAGTSAGGGIAAVLANLYRDDGLSPPLTGLYLAVPTLMPPGSIPRKYAGQHTSRDDHANNIFMSAKMSAWAHCKRAQDKSTRCQS
jgi:acetyl esterase/lipase